jgi:drug/metabolite transporter (DMT)-like permease
LTDAPTSARAGLPRLGLILLALVTLGWGTSWPAMKFALNEMPPWTFRGLVVPTAGVILFIIARAGGLSLAVPRGRWPALLGASLFNIVGWNVLIAYGVSLMASGRASVIAYTMPLWVSIFSVFILGESLTLRRIAALVLGMGAIWILISGDLEILGAVPAGVLFVIGAAMSWAMGIVLLKRIPWGMPTVSLAAWQLVIGGLPIAIVALVIEYPELQPVSGVAVAAVIYTVLGPTCFCVYGYFKVISLFPAGVSAIGALMIPVIGVASSSLLLGEPVGWREGTALVLVCSALGLVLLGPLTRQR